MPVVNDMRLDEETGGIGVWVGMGTIGYFDRSGMEHTEDSMAAGDMRRHESITGGRSRRGRSIREPDQRQYQQERSRPRHPSGLIRRWVLFVDQSCQPMH